MNLRQNIQDHRVASGHVALWPLGQSGFIVKSPAGKIVAIDPYLTNSCQPLGVPGGINMDRLFPPPLFPADLAGIDRYVMTHSHQDHLDPETLAGYRAAGGRGSYLCPAETADKLRKLGVPADQILVTWPNQVHRVGDLQIRATFAIPNGPDDLTHVGYLVAVDDGPRVYFTGDTAYHDILAIAMKPHHPDVLVAVINGAYLNMGAREAARLARELDVKIAIPCHHDLFPDNSVPPRMLRSNLQMEGIADRYRAPAIGQAYTYPE